MHTHTHTHQQAADGAIKKESSGRSLWSSPVITDSSQRTYRGAAVGYNNTGKVTAITEALLLAHQQGWQKITIHTDSQWIVNTSTGRWKAKCHHDLIQLAKKTLQTC